MVKKLKELRLAANQTQQTMANYLSISQQAYANYESGKRAPDYETLKRLTDFFNVTTDALLGVEPKPKKKSVKIPVLGYVRAGIPIEAVEEILDYEEIPEELAQSGEYFALSIKGDSMEPRICEGDVVIVRKQQDIESGELAVILINGCDATVKKVIKKDTSIMLVPFNKSYEPVLYSNKEINSLPVAIVGKVVELRGKF